MKTKLTEPRTDSEDPEDDLWFLPGPPEDDDLPPLPRAEPGEGDQIADWVQAEAAQAGRLAQVAARLGALDDRLLRGPDGWRHRLALIEASELSWQTGDRITADRLGLWAALRISAVQDDTTALHRTTWAFRRLTGGPGPETGLTAFLGRHDTRDGLLTDKLDAWSRVVRAAPLHPICRAAFGLHLWPLAGIGPDGDLLEGRVIAARLAVEGQSGGAVFAPFAMGGLRDRWGGGAAQRLAYWLGGMEQATLTAQRHLDRIEAWHIRAIDACGGLSGRTPPRLIEALRDWPLISAPMAEEITGASRAAVQRNLIWMMEQGLVREVTGQGRFRLWRADG